MAYEPQPGTIAFRAIAWLQKQPQGTELTASMWAESIDTDGNTLGICIKPAVDAGLVRRFTKNGLSRPLWFTLGDGVPVEKPAPDEDGEQMPTQRIVPAAEAPRIAGVKAATLLQPTEPSADAAADARVVASPAPSPAPTPRSEPAAPAPQPQISTEEYVARIGVEAEERIRADSLPFNACRYIDGSLVVVGVEVRDDGAIVFSPKQARDLWKLRDAA